MNNCKPTIGQQCELCNNNTIVELENWDDGTQYWICEKEFKEDGQWANRWNFERT